MRVERMVRNCRILDWNVKALHGHMLLLSSILGAH